jgi:hypothetical protein
MSCFIIVMLKYQMMELFGGTTVWVISCTKVFDFTSRMERTLEAVHGPASIHQSGVCKGPHLRRRVAAILAPKSL